MRRRSNGGGTKRTRFQNKRKRRSKPDKKPRRINYVPYEEPWHFPFSHLRGSFGL